MDATTIGLTGGMCSGKDSWANLLVNDFGFEWQGTSDIVREYIREYNLGIPTRDLVRRTSTHLREVYGPAHLVEQALGRLDDSKPRIVSGIYTVPELEFIRGIGGRIIHIVADNETAFSRMSMRGREGEGASRDEYERLMRHDLQSPDTDQRLADVIKMADAEIDGSVPIAETGRCRILAVEVFKQLGIQVDV